MKKAIARISDRQPSPVARHRLVAMLDALSAECLSLAYDEGAGADDYARVLTDIETLAEVLREWERARKGERGTEVPGTRVSLTLEQAKRVIEELRAEDAVRNDVQRALA